jgi:hypothetical protein
MRTAKSRFLACALGSAAALAAVWLLLAVTASASPPPPAAPTVASTVVVGPLTAISGSAGITPSAAIDLRKTAGTHPLSCGTNNYITVVVGTSIVYCYVAYNTGNITLTRHSAIDNQLGVVLTDKVFNLGPGSGVYFTVATTLNVSTTNTAVWTASNPGPSDVVSDTDAATVTVFAALRWLPALFLK